MNQLRTIYPTPAEGHLHWESKTKCLQLQQKVYNEDQLHTSSGPEQLKVKIMQLHTEDHLPLQPTEGHLHLDPTEDHLPLEPAKGPLHLELTEDHLPQGTFTLRTN